MLLFHVYTEVKCLYLEELFDKSLTNHQFERTFKELMSAPLSVGRQVIIFNYTGQFLELILELTGWFADILSMSGRDPVQTPIFEMVG